MKQFPMDDNQLNKACFYLSCCETAHIRAVIERGSAAAGGAMYFNVNHAAVRFAENFSFVQI